MADGSEVEEFSDADLAFGADTRVFGIRPLNAVNHGQSWYHKTCVPSNVLGYRELLIVAGKGGGSSNPFRVGGART